MLRLVALAGAAAALANGKPSVMLYMEFGCTLTRRYMLGPLRAAVEDPQTADSMDLEVNPFGNAFFAIEECEEAKATSSTVPSCGGAGGYDRGRRDCFNQRCGPGSGSAASERETSCFRGPLVYQFGFAQMYSTRFAVCAMRQAKDDWRRYVPYLICVEEKFDDIHDGSSSADVARACASQSGLDGENLTACYNSREPDLALREMALATPEHPGVPWITVDGAEQAETYESGALVMAVRRAKAAAARGPVARAALAHVGQHVALQRPRSLRARGQRGQEEPDRWAAARNLTC